MFKEFKKITNMSYEIENIHNKVKSIPFGTLHCSICIL